jgi:hypothetical protein
MKSCLPAVVLIPAPFYASQHPDFFSLEMWGGSITVTNATVWQRKTGGVVKIFAYPGYLIGGEIAKLINRGYQQFFKTTKTEVPATADQLKALHQFTEELKESIGVPSLYNESLGTVSENYVYDRVQHRDEPAAARPKKPWEKAKGKRHA